MLWAVGGTGGVRLYVCDPRSGREHDCAKHTLIALPLFNKSLSLSSVLVRRVGRFSMTPLVNRWSYFKTSITHLHARARAWVSARVCVCAYIRVFNTPNQGSV